MGCPSLLTSPWITGPPLLMSTSTSRYNLDINSDGSLTFHADGHPDMKMTPKSLKASAVSGKYEGSVPFIIDITMDYGATTVDVDLNIKVASQEIKCDAESYKATDTLISFDNIGNDGDCMGDALRGQGKDTSKYTLDINDDGSLTFHSDGYPDMKMTKQSQYLVV